MSLKSSLGDRFRMSGARTRPSGRRAPNLYIGRPEPQDLIQEAMSELEAVADEFNEISLIL